MGKTITVRLDPEAEQALSLLQRAGLSTSEAIRGALIESKREVLRAEADRIAASPEDRREIAEIHALLDEISEPW